MQYWILKHYQNVSVVSEYYSLCTCTRLERSSHSLCTRGRARRCPRVPV